MPTTVLEPRTIAKDEAPPTIPKTMRAAVVEKFRAPLQLREVPVPSPGPGQL
jgi:hypothetical protein